MTQTLMRRVGMALGLWTLLRYQTRLCRSFSIGDDDGSQALDASEAPRWLGRVRIGRDSRHALVCPPSRPIVYRFLAPPRSKVVAWCALQPFERLSNGAEFCIAVRTEGSTHQLIERLCLNPVRTPGDRRWRKLVLDLHNDDHQRIEVTFSTSATDGGTGTRTLWGEPRLEWSRPFSETRGLLRAAFSQALRGRPLSAARTLHGRLSEQSNPPLYDIWLSQRNPSRKDLARMRTLSESFAHRPLLSVVTPVYNTDARWLRACIESVRAQAYPRWQLCLADDGSTRSETREVLLEYRDDPRIRIHTLPRNGGIAAASNAALALAEGEFVAFLDHDDELGPDALFEVAAHLNEHPDTDFIYTDEDKLELDGTRTGPYFKPDWSPEHFLTNMYTCHLMVVRRALLERIGGFRAGFDGAQDYDLVLRLIDHTSRIHHLPKVLYRWRRIPESTASTTGSETAKPLAHDAGKRALEEYVRRNNLNAEVLPGALRYIYRVRFAIRDEPLVSVVLPAVPRSSDPEARRLCERTLRTLAEHTLYRRFEVVRPVGGGGTNDTSLQIPGNLPIREVQMDDALPPNALHQQAMGAAAARGDHLLFLDWGLQALDTEWLTALLEFSQQSAIGVVGAKLHYPDGSLKHIGILLGVNGVAAPACHRHPGSSLGYWGTAIAARNYSAVSGICMMTRRNVYEQVRGIDGEMGVLGDVDYCLRVTAAGYRVAFTPDARLVHAALPSLIDADVTRAGNHLKKRWGDRLARDPYYNPNLSRNSPDYELDSIFNPVAPWVPVFFVRPITYSGFNGFDMLTPKRTCLVVLSGAAISVNATAWRIPESLTLGLTLAGVISLFVGPGIMLLGFSRRRSPARSIHLIYVAVTGPLLLATVGLIAWLAGDLVPPRLVCRGAAIVLIGGGLLWTLQQPSDLRLSKAECRAMLFVFLLTLVAAGRSIHSLGVRGELYAGTVTRTLAPDGRSDARVPFIIPIDVANRWNPFSSESQAFYSPYTFTSRGPLVGLAATPAVLTWGRVKMRTIANMDEPFEAIDPYGYMQYRFSIIVFGALALIPFFVALGGAEAALAGTAIYALSPFLVHEVYFTWTKQATVPLLLSAFCLAVAGRPGLAGILAGLAYLAHPSAAFAALAFVPFLVAVVPYTEWTVNAAGLLRVAQWWQRRGAIAAFLSGMTCALLPWSIYSYGPDPAGFATYVYLADGRAPDSIWHWVMSRMHSLGSTLVPLYAFLNFHSHPIMLPVFEPPLRLVTFFTQYFYTLPAGVGFVWFCWRLPGLVRSLWQTKGFATIMIGLPFTIFWILWGATVTGLLREGLHVTFAFLMLTWVRFMPAPELCHPLLHRARVIELLAFMWIPTIVSHRTVANPSHLTTDLLGLFVSIAAVLLLTRFATRPASLPTNIGENGLASRDHSYLVV